MKKIFTVVLTLGLVGASLLPSFAQAQSLSDDIKGQYQKSAQTAEIGAVDPREAAAELIKIMLTLTGTIFLALIVYAGYTLLTARGDESKVEKAQKTIRAAVIGLVITLAAYSITAFVGNSARKAVNNNMSEPDDSSTWSDFNTD